MRPVKEPLLELNNITCGYGKRAVLRGISFRVMPGEIWCVLGRNGAGKTTLFRTILGSLQPLTGEMKIDGRSTSEMSRSEIARSIAYVPQHHTPPFAFTVKEIAVMGRNAYIGTFGVPGPGDEKVADDVMADLGIDHLADRRYTQISGGERQMVLIARAMVQQPRLLMMDEPAANLDYGNQVKIMRKMKQLAGSGISIIFTTHDPEHAFYCDAKVAAIEDPDTLHTGKAEIVITEDLIRRMYGIRTFMLEGEDPDGKKVSSIIPRI